METREEKIKKIKDQIHDELEKMSDEELDRVAGGNYHETGADSRFLNDLDKLCDRFGDTAAFFYPHTVRDAVKAGWEKVGIKFFDYNTDNEYYLGDKQLTRRQAIKFACDKYGKDLNKMPGDYHF